MLYVSLSSVHGVVRDFLSCTFTLPTLGVTKGEKERVVSSAIFTNPDFVLLLKDMIQFVVALTQEMGIIIFFLKVSQCWKVMILLIVVAPGSKWSTTA